MDEVAIPATEPASEAPSALDGCCDLDRTLGRCLRLTLLSGGPCRAASLGGWEGRQVRNIVIVNQQSRLSLDHKGFQVCCLVTIWILIIKHIAMPSGSVGNVWIFCFKSQKEKLNNSTLTAPYGNR